MTNDNNEKHWLQKLKDESWEAELIVSAIAIFSSFQLFSFIEWGAEGFVDLLHPKLYGFAGVIATVALFGASILVAMFIIHFFLRSYWVGLVGLNSVFPEYNVEEEDKLSFYNRMMVAILPKLEDTVEQVDELCSVIFAAAFSGSIIYFFPVVSASIYLLVFNALEPITGTWILLIPIAILTFMSLLNGVWTILIKLGLLTLTEGQQLLYYKLGKFINICLFGPAYKLFLQVIMSFTTNFSRKKHISYLIWLFMGFGFIFALIQSGNSITHYLLTSDGNPQQKIGVTSVYRDQNSVISYLVTPEISSDIISTPVIRLFIPSFRHQRETVEALCGELEVLDKFTNIERRNARKEHSVACAPNYHSIYVNGYPVTTNFRFTYHPNTNQAGIVAYIDIESLERGEHSIKVKKTLESAHEFTWEIPFFYSPESS